MSDHSPRLDVESADVEQLFHVDNLDRATMGPLEWALLLLWFPFGLVLMLARAAGAILAALVVPAPYRAWWFCFFAGIYPRTKGKQKIREEGLVVVSNHISYFDRMTVAAAVRSRVPLATLIWHKVNWLNRVMARPVLLVRGTGRNRTLIPQVKKHLETGNILLFPEATVTDGHGVLRFEKMAFSLDAPVMLVTLRYRTAFPFLRPSALYERLFFQAFYALFQPWTVAKMEVLGTYEREPEESPEDFSKRAQTLIAEALGVPGTDYTWRDRRRLLREHGRDLTMPRKERKAIKKEKKSRSAPMVPLPSTEDEGGPSQG